MTAEVPARGAVFRRFSTSKGQTLELGVATAVPVPGSTRMAHVMIWRPLVRMARITDRVIPIAAPRPGDLTVRQAMMLLPHGERGAFLNACRQLRWIAHRQRSRWAQTPVVVRRLDQDLARFSPLLDQALASMGGGWATTADMAPPDWRPAPPSAPRRPPPSRPGAPGPQRAITLRDWFPQAPGIS